MMLTPIPVDAIKIDQACVFSLVGEPRNVRWILRVTIVTLIVVCLQSVYLFVCVSKPIAKLERTVAMHSTQIESIIGAMEFGELAQSKLWEQLNGK